MADSNALPTARLADSSTTRMLVALGLALGVAACSGEPDQVNLNVDVVNTGDGGTAGGTDPITAEVRAAAWVRNHTAIDGYTVTAPTGDAVNVQLVDDAGAALGTMRITALVDAADARRDGAIQATLTMDGTEALTLTTNGITRTDGYVTAMRLQAPDGRETQLRARQRFQRCYDAPPPSTPTSPTCANPLALGPDAYTLPSCGQLRFRLEQSRLASQLVDLTYIQDAPDALPDAGALRWQDATPTQARLNVLRRGTITDAATVDDWLATTGAGAIIGSRAERLLTAAYQDFAWRPLAEQALGNLSGLPSNNAPAKTCKITAGAEPKICGSESWLDNVESLTGALAAGDPHMISHDRLAFNFQGAGEFILATHSDDAVMVQARFEPLRTSSVEAGGAACGAVTVTTAVAVRFNDGTVVAIYAGDVTDIRVDDTPVADAAALAAALPASVTLETNGRDYTFTLPTGETIDVEDFGNNILNVSMRVPEARRGTFAGIFGTTGGGPDDDFTLADGSRLPAPPARDQLYGAFADAWRVTDAAESLFSYRAPATGPADFNLPGFPSAIARVDSLDDAVRSAAEAACEIVDGEPLNTWCILDTACTGAAGFPGLYASVPSPDARMSETADPIITVGLLNRGLPGSVAVDDIVPAAQGCRLPAPTVNRVFAEALDVTLASDVTVDIAAPGTYASNSDLPGLQTVPAGTNVDVYFIHLPARSLPSQSIAGVRFGREIAGVALSASTLADSDRFANSSPRPGVAALTYPGAAADRGPELASNPVTIAPGGQAIEIALDSIGAADQLRIFVTRP